MLTRDILNRLDKCTLVETMLSMSRTVRTQDRKIAELSEILANLTQDTIQVGSALELLSLLEAVTPQKTAEH